MFVMFNEEIAALKFASFETRIPEAFSVGTLLPFSIVNHTLESCCEKESKEAIIVVKSHYQRLIAKSLYSAGLIDVETMVVSYLLIYVTAKALCRWYLTLMLVNTLLVMMMKADWMI